MPDFTGLYITRNYFATLSTIMEYYLSVWDLWCHHFLYFFFSISTILNVLVDLENLFWASFECIFLGSLMETLPCSTLKSNKSDHAAILGKQFSFGDTEYRARVAQTTALIGRLKTTRIPAHPQSEPNLQRPG